MASNNVASEVNSTVAKLNDRLAGGSDEAKNGATTNIITLEGEKENNGATMEDAGYVDDLVVVEAGGGDEEESVVSAYTSSNCQAVNNSVLVAGSCAFKDPGVDVVIVEHVDEIRDCADDDLFEEGELAN